MTSTSVTPVVATPEAATAQAAKAADKVAATKVVAKAKLDAVEAAAAKLKADAAKKIQALAAKVKAKAAAKKKAAKLALKKQKKKAALALKKKKAAAEKAALAGLPTRLEHTGLHDMELSNQRSAHRLAMHVLNARQQLWHTQKRTLDRLQRSPGARAARMAARSIRQKAKDAVRGQEIATMKMALKTQKKE